MRFNGSRIASAICPTWKSILRLVRLPLSGTMRPCNSPSTRMLLVACAPMRLGVHRTSSSYAASTGSKASRMLERIIWDTKYLVLGLGDVYLGAPVATPIDPRHRLVTTKYNPARTWTPDNVVGIGGAYMCIYGMEGPGGYQLYGRTCQVWNTYREKPASSSKEDPLALRFFDQVQFYPVSPEELVTFRDGFLAGRCSIEIEPTTSSFRDYDASCRPTSKASEGFKCAGSKQPSTLNAAVEGRPRIKPSADAIRQATPGRGASFLPDVATRSKARCPAVFGRSWWNPVAGRGGDTLIVVESMKMEMAVAHRRRARARDALRRRPRRQPRAKPSSSCERSAHDDLSRHRQCSTAYAHGDATPADRPRGLRPHPSEKACGRTGSRWSKKMHGNRRARRSPRPALRHSLRRQGQYRRRRARRPPAPVPNSPTSPNAPPQSSSGWSSRRDPDRQDQSRSIRHRPQRHPLALRHPACPSTPTIFPAARAPARPSP